MMLRSVLALAVCLFAAPAVADEVWDTPLGPIIYESEANGAAIFSFFNVDGSRATLVIPGLAGNYDNRSLHDAFWIGQGSQFCEAALSLPGQRPSAQWGKAQVIFDKPAFPTSLTVSLGYCFDPLSYGIRGTIR